MHRPNGELCKHKTGRAAVCAVFTNRQMKNVTKLALDGNNGDTYFSWDGKKSIFQSTYNGYACDKIWTINFDVSDKLMVSLDHRSHTCSFFFPDNKIIFASPALLPGAWPPKPETPKGMRERGQIMFGSRAKRTSTFTSYRELGGIGRGFKSSIDCDLNFVLQQITMSQSHFSR